MNHYTHSPKMRKVIIKTGMITLLVSMLSSVSFSAFAERTLNYIDLLPEIKAKADLKICVATWDQREVVVNGNQSARFVGYIRSATAIAYPIKNESDENFSEVMSATVSNALNKSGCSASIIKTECKNTKDEVLSNLKNQDADVYIMITMNKWRTDTRSMSFTKVATQLIYNLTVEIYDKSGNLLATNTLDTIEPDLAPSGSSSTKKIQKTVVTPKYPEVMTKLFATEDIEKALG